MTLPSFFMYTIQNDLKSQAYDTEFMAHVFYKMLDKNEPSMIL